MIPWSLLGWAAMPSLQQTPKGSAVSILIFSPPFLAVRHLQSPPWSSTVPITRDAVIACAQQMFFQSPTPFGRCTFPRREVSEEQGSDVLFSLGFLRYF